MTPLPRRSAPLLLALGLISGFGSTAASAATDSPPTLAAALATTLAGGQRPAEHKADDAWRRPGAVLAFLGLQANQKVIELWPGEGWHTEILAPYLRDDGRLIAALAPVTSPVVAKQRSAFVDKLADDPETFGETALVTFDPARSDIRPVGGVDLVFTDGNVDTWLRDGAADKAFAAIYRALKSGGVFGVILPAARTPDDDQAVVAAARAAGLTPDGRLEIGGPQRVALRFRKPLEAPVPEDVVRFVQGD